MKKIVKLILVTAVLALGLLAVACGGSEEVSFTKDSSVRTTYVQGQDFDFSGISLTSEKKNKTESIPLDSEGVTISGYDKNKLGEQVVTIAYNDALITVNVTVIPRVSVEGYDKNYFVGDSFNKQNGRVKVADDNANITTYNLSSDTVTVTGFDSASVGEKSITVSCGGYSCEVPVNILGAETVKLHAPSKKSYQSHEEGFDVSGGYFTVVSTGGLISKTVPLSIDMVKYFDLSVATIENRTNATAAKQTVIIEYLNQSFEFDISIKYSEVSIIKQRAAEFASVDYKDTISSDIGEAAIDAINEYLDLSSAKKAYITQDEADIVLKVAASYAYAEFVKEADKYSHTFTLEPSVKNDSDGNLIEYCSYFTVSCDSYQNMKDTLEALRDESSRFNELSSLLFELEDEFSSVEMDDGVNLDKYFAKLFIEEDLPFVSSLFKEMVTIYEAVSVVPDDWDNETIKAEAMVDGIERAYLRIVSSEYSYLSYYTFYDIISSWREKDDLYEIIHTHYYYNKTYTGEENYVSTVWEKIPLPAPLQQMYSIIAEGYSESASLSQMVYDTTYFVILYRNALELSDFIKNGDSQLYKDIYNAIDFDKLINGYLYDASTTGLYGYTKVLGNLNYNKDLYDLIWGDYFAIVELADEDGFIDFENSEAIAAIKKLLEDFFSITPYERYLIICSLYSNYSSLKIEDFVFDSELSTGSFINTIFFLYCNEETGLLPEAAREVFEKLMIATEQHGIRYKYLSVASEATAEYIKLMDDVIKLYGVLSPEDRQKFDNLVGFAYTENLELYNSLKSDAPSVSQYPLLEELKYAVDAYYKILAAINSDTSEGKKDSNDKGYFALMFTAYENVSAIREQILASNDADMLLAYRTYDYVTLNENDENDANNYKLTLEAIADTVAVSSLSYTITLTNDDGTKVSYNAVRYYTDKGIAEFMKASFKVLYNGFCNTANNKDDVLSLMTKFRALDKDAVSIFYSLNLDACYYDAVEKYFASVLSEDETTAALAAALIEAERNYASYYTDNEDSEALSDFLEYWNSSVKPAYNALGTSLDNYGEYLKDMYEFYLSIYETLTQQQ